MEALLESLDIIAYKANIFCVSYFLRLLLIPAYIPCYYSVFAEFTPEARSTGIKVSTHSL